MARSNGLCPRLLSQAFLLDPDPKKERDPILFERESLSRAFEVASVQLSSSFPCAISLE